MKRQVLVVRKTEGGRGSISRSTSVRYGVCQRNHAANSGGYAVDGCREFIASGEEANAALTCAACGCHRNFHKRLEKIQGQRHSFPYELGVQERLLIRIDPSTSTSLIGMIGNSFRLLVEAKQFWARILRISS
ncbi:hypothetical protein K1719_009774 [Acacia pycnantha]|nr:hypothetical protein K1719_009774 [Acacia pycnantha]